MLGDLYWTEYKIPLAEPQYLAELSVDPNSVAANYKLGGLRVIEGNPSGAIAPLQQALSLDPTFYKAIYYLGRAYADMGRDNDALLYLKRATTAPNDSSLKALAWYQLTRLYRREGHTDEAGIALEQFKTLRSQIDSAENARRTALTRPSTDLPLPEQLPPANTTGEDTKP
jgi:tetratricopeptide (TPR) repeat protein